MALTTLRDVLVHELQDLYNAENQLSKALPKMINAVMNDELREAMEHHEKETNNQIGRLKRVFKIINESPGSEHCDAMEGLVKEAEGIISENGRNMATDAALIAAAQRIEHYEMAGYGSAKAFAKELDLDDVADLLDETLDEESDANKKLTKLATGGMFSTGVNKEAVPA